MAAERTHPLGVPSGDDPVAAMAWFWHFLSSCGFGLAAAIIPIFNNEAYILVSQYSGLAGAIPVVLGLGLGNGMGKTLVFWLWRRGTTLPWAKKAQIRWRWVERLLDYVSSPIIGPLLVLTGAAVSVPPLYPLTLVAASSAMRLRWFALAVTVGELLRMSWLVAAALGLLSLL